MRLTRLSVEGERSYNILAKTPLFIQLTKKLKL